MASTSQRSGHAPYAEEDVESPQSAMTSSPTDNGYTYGSFPVLDGSPSAHPSANGGAANPTKPTKTSPRALAPDLVRGLLMIIMALDHTAIGLHVFPHGTGCGGEADGFVVRRWNKPAAYIVRSLTHLCAPGFTFLLGMGVVYLVRSRARLGWSGWRLIRYFAIRAVVLTLVSVAFGLVVTAGHVWFLNMVLFSLGVDYFLAGVLYLGVLKTEKALAGWLAKGLRAEDKADEDAEPLLPRSNEDGLDPTTAKAESLSWHIHNVLLLALSIITIFWNIWFSATHGHCPNTASTTAQPTSLVLRVWLWPFQEEHAWSQFPPLAWVSFSILGLIYGRILLARPWSPRALATGHAAVGSLFFLVFVLTRVLRFGNLSEGCLRTPEHEAHPETNPYLVSATSFFYVVKYPPDVAFWSLTMAVDLFLLGGFGAIPVQVAKRFTMLLDFGTSSLFFYIVHMFLVFGLGTGLVVLFGHDVGFGEKPDSKYTMGVDNLWVYFATWAAAMLLLWPVCRWYSRFKSTKPADSIWRFF